MAGFREWWGEVQQKLLTNLVNRTFKKNPGLVDRLAMLLLQKIVGETPHDPELDHPEG